MSGFRDAVFTTPEMAAVFSDAAFVRRMLEFEAALARAQARAGLISGAAADAIKARCRLDLFDLPSLFREAAEAGTPVLPLVRRLAEVVDAKGKPFVHFGATSQDAIDTAAMLQMREGLELLEERLLAAGAACARLAEEHRGTPMVGRTLLQHAVPITFGLKAARWLGLVTRLVRRLRAVRREALAVQLGGAAGTLAPYGEAGAAVMERLADELELPAPEMPWHTERDRVVEIASAVAAVAAGMAKIATDIALLSQTEVGELSTGATALKGRSSTMPHKRNPVEATAALAAARLAVAMAPAVLAAAVQEHERSAGAWQAEWEAVPRLFCFSAGAVEWVVRALGDLRVDAARMRENLDGQRGMIMAEALTMALAPALGRQEAYRLVQRAADRAAEAGLSLGEAVRADEQISKAISAERLAAALDVTRYLGSAETFVDRALAGFRALEPADGRSRRRRA